MLKKLTLKSEKLLKSKYSFENYKPNKNAKPVTYKGTKYLSKAQCMALESITRKELDEYLKNQSNITIEEPIEEEVATVDQLEVEELLNV